MNDNTNAIAQFKKTATEALDQLPTAQPSIADIDALTASFLAALYALNHDEPRKPVSQSSLVVGFPKAKYGPTQNVVVEIPQFLHTVIKSGCILRRTTMGGEITALLEKHYLNLLR